MSRVGGNTSLGNSVLLTKYFVFCSVDLWAGLKYKELTFPNVFTEDNFVLACVTALTLFCTMIRR